MIGKMYDHLRFIISSAAMSKSKIRFSKSEKIGSILRVYNMKIAEATNPLLMKSDPSAGVSAKISVNNS